MNPKKITLRAFSITNNDISRSSSELLQLMLSKLSITTVADRKMLLNENDPAQEEDLISNFETLNNDTKLCLSLLRIRKGNGTVKVPMEKLNSQRFSMTELETLAESDSIYKDIKYILLDDEKLIVSWVGYNTIKSVQTYLNWILKDVRGNFIFELTPMSRRREMATLKNIKSITMGNNFSLPRSNNNENNFFKRNFNVLKKEILTNFFDLCGDLDERIVEEIVSAQLMLKFKKKPKEMDQESYDQTFGAIMKPILDTEDIVFETKAGTKIKAENILLTKEVEVDVTSNNQISEQSLFQEMEIFMNEIVV